jgi:hypothetical protein
MSLRSSYRGVAFPIAMVMVSMVWGACAPSERELDEGAGEGVNAHEEALLTLSTAPTSTSTSTGTVAAPCLLDRLYFAGACRTRDWLKTTLSSPGFESAEGPTNANDAAKAPYVVVQERTADGWQRLTYTSAPVPSWMPKRGGYGLVGKIDLRADRDLEGHFQTRLVVTVPEQRRGAISPPLYTWRVEASEITTYLGSAGTETRYQDGSYTHTWPSTQDCLDQAYATYTQTKDSCWAAAKAHAFARADAVETANVLACEVADSNLGQLSHVPVVACAAAFEAVFDSLYMDERSACLKLAHGASENVRLACEEEHCEAPKKWCVENCIEVQNDPNNCGDCGVKCNGSASCIDGTCVPQDEPEGGSEPSGGPYH